VTTSIKINHGNKNRIVNRRKRPFWLLIISLLSLGGLIYLIFSFPPSFQFSIGNYNLPILYLFFFLLFIFFLSFISYAFRSPRQGALLGLLIIAYLVFRMFHLNNPYLPFLLIALFITLALFFKKHI